MPDYTVGALAKLSGVSPRTLRYYDRIGLLKPERLCANGYRVYGRAQVDKLQQILFYRTLGFELEDIRQLTASADFDRIKALETHLAALAAQKAHLDGLIQTVNKTIEHLKGERDMTDAEKFEGFKQKLIADNEEKYGSEIRARYGDEAVNGSNAQVAGMNPEQWARQEALSKEILDRLAAALASGDPAGQDARRACELHRQWLCMFWKPDAYSKEAHRGLGALYVSDERFRAYYDDALGEGAAEFFKKAIDAYAK